MENPKPSWSIFLDRAARFRYPAIAVLALLLLAGIIFRSQIGGFFGPHVPPPPCGAAALQVRGLTFRMQNLAANAQVPAGKPGVAYWIQGTTAHYVFALSPTGDSRLLADQFVLGDRIKIAWGDCTSEEFIITSIQPSVPAQAALLDQSAPGMTIFVPSSNGSSGWSLIGKRPETIAAPPRETETPNPVQAEISFLDQTTSADGKTLHLKISVKNTGTNPIHLSQSDISLASAAPSSVDPALPVDIQPGATQALTLTFAKPSGSTAVLNVLYFSVDIYF